MLLSGGNGNHQPDSLVNHVEKAENLNARKNTNVYVKIKRTEWSRTDSHKESTDRGDRVVREK